MRPKLPAIKVSGGHLVPVIREPAAAAAARLIDRIAGEVGPPDVLVSDPVLARLIDERPDSIRGRGWPSFRRWTATVRCCPGRRAAAFRVGDPAEPCSSRAQG